MVLRGGCGAPRSCQYSRGGWWLWIRAGCWHILVNASCVLAPGLLFCFVFAGWLAIHICFIMLVIFINLLFIFLVISIYIYIHIKLYYLLRVATTRPESIATTLPYYINMIEVHHTFHKVQKADEHIFAGCFNLAPFVPATSPPGPTDWLAFSFVLASCRLGASKQCSIQSR